MVITMTMRNTDFTNLLRRRTTHRVPLRLHPACPAGSRQPNLKEEKDFDKYEGKRPGCSRRFGPPQRWRLAGRTRETKEI